MGNYITSMSETIFGSEAKKEVTIESQIHDMKCGVLCSFISKTNEKFMDDYIIG